jgi:hypothetical protein
MRPQYFPKFSMCFFAAIILVVIVGAVVLAEEKSDNPPRFFGPQSPRDWTTAPIAQKDELVEKATGVWNKVYSLAKAFSGREVDFVVLAPKATYPDGPEQRPFPPGAMIVTNPARVFVSYSLLEAVYKDKQYPEDFLAFVLGHELGHRIGDLDYDGKSIPARNSSSFAGFSSSSREPIADKRGALFMTLAGYHPSQIASDDMVTHFFNAHYTPEGIQAPSEDELKERRAALLHVLTNFESYEAMYQAGLLLSFSDDAEGSKRILGWLDELLSENAGGKNSAPLPEIKAVRAFALIHHASADAPVFSEMNLTEFHEKLGCEPVYPSHTSYWSETQRARQMNLMGAGQKGATEDLEKALSLLEQAKGMGLSPILVESGIACANYYLGNRDNASKAQKLAEAALTKNTPASVQTRLAENGSLIVLLEQGKIAPFPSESLKKNRAAWAKGILVEMPNQNTTIARWLVELANGTANAKPQRAIPTFPGAGKKVAFVAWPEIFAGDFGACPTGWEKQTIPEKSVAEERNDGQGVTVCRDTDGEKRIIRIDLNGSTQPPYRILSRDMLVLTGSALLSTDPSAYGVSENWIPAGVADGGETFWTQQNDSVIRLLTVDEKKQVTRACVMR